MEKENYFVAYDSEKKMANDIFEESSKNISGLKEKEKAEVAQKKKEATASKKSKNSLIEKMSKQKDDDVAKIDEEQKNGILNLENTFSDAKKELENNIAKAKAKKDEEIEEINFNKTNFNANAENEKVNMQNKHNDISLNRKKAFEDLESKKEEEIQKFQSASTEKQNEITAQINKKINEYFAETKKMEDANKKAVKEKTDETKKLNGELEEKIKIKTEEYNKVLKEKQGALAKVGTKQEASVLNKEVNALTKSNSLEMKNLENEKISNTKALQNFENQALKELDISLEAKRKEIIDVVTKLQGEIDVDALELQISLKNFENGYGEEKRNLFLMELKEKNDAAIENLTASNLKEVDINIENKKIDVSTKNFEISVDKLNIDIEFETKKAEQQKYVLTQVKNLEKEKVVFEFNKEKENILSQIDIDDYTLSRDLRKIDLDSQKEVLLLKQSVYHANNELMLKTNSIVIEHKKKRIADALNPFLEEINKKKESFGKKYDELIANQNKEFEDTLKLLEEVNKQKISYLEAAKELIAETDDNMIKKYDDLINSEIVGYEDTVKEITSMNDVIIKAYDNKKYDDIQKINEEIANLHGLNEYIIDSVDKVEELCKGKLDNSTNINNGFKDAFDLYYQREIKSNEDNYNALVNERKNTLAEAIGKLESEFAILSKKTQQENNNSEVNLSNFNNECNTKKQKLDEQYLQYVDTVRKEKEIFTTDRSAELNKLKSKCETEFSTELKKMNAENILQKKNLNKEVATLTKAINKTKAKISSNIKFNYKNAKVVKNKKWWIKPEKE